ncbi:hypothetical protein DMENIID0001_091140 [Sergentomyia squamirostris]
MATVEKAETLTFAESPPRASDEEKISPGAAAVEIVREKSPKVEEKLQEDVKIALPDGEGVTAGGTATEEDKEVAPPTTPPEESATSANSKISLENLKVTAVGGEKINKEVKDSILEDENPIPVDPVEITESNHTQEQHEGENATPAVAIKAEKRKRAIRMTQFTTSGHHFLLKTPAALLKKRSIKWLNRNKYQLSKEKLIYESNMRKNLRFNYSAFMEEDQPFTTTSVSAKNLPKVAEEVEEFDEEDMVEEDEDVEEMEEVVKLSSKRPRTDDDPKMIKDAPAMDKEEEESTKKKVKKVEEEVSCDRRNGDDERKPEQEKKKETMLPSKKLSLELEMNFASHDRILSEYIEASASENVSDIEHHVEQLIVEIQTLNDMIRAKELEWNNMLHLKKVKEEIVARLTRKKHVLNSSVSIDEMQKFTREQESSLTKLTHAILLNRAANMGGNEPMNPKHAGESSSGRNSTFSAADLFNGHNARLTQQQQMGRQGAIKDVKSIIADYRQRHPEIVPRRGRRMKMSLTADNAVKESSNSRPSSTDSTHSNNATTQTLSSTTGTTTTTTGNNLSFKDVLVQFAKLSQGDRQLLQESTAAALNSSPKAPPPYPEVTLYPVNHSNATSSAQTPNDNSHTNSLLHGILTKSSNQQQSTRSATNQAASGFTSFSPTLARLLTAPERITSQQNLAAGAAGQFQQQQQQLNPALNLSKAHNSEITITPVVTNQSNLQQNVLQQQRFDNSAAGIQVRMKHENIFNIDDEADDSADRLVIDEGNDRNMIESTTSKEQQISIGQEFHENEVPECQGCKKREAQFVCAGCGNQWYCSRECQVSAWDEHSEVCTG